MNIGEKIKTLRKSNNKSQEELAFDIGVSRQTINKWETNKVQPNAENLVSLCSIFEVSADYFLESELANNDQKVITSTPVPKSGVNRKGLIICSIIDAIFLLIGALWTVIFGFVTFNTNIGEDVVGTDSIGISNFVVMLLLTVLFLIIEVLLLIFIFKNRQKTTKVDKKVN